MWPLAISRYISRGADAASTAAASATCTAVCTAGAWRGRGVSRGGADEVAGAISRGAARLEEAERRPRPARPPLAHAPLALQGAVVPWRRQAWRAAARSARSSSARRLALLALQLLGKLGRARLELIQRQQRKVTGEHLDRLLRLPLLHRLPRPRTAALTGQAAAHCTARSAGPLAPLGTRSERLHRRGAPCCQGRQPARRRREAHPIGRRSGGSARLSSQRRLRCLERRGLVVRREPASLVVRRGGVARRGGELARPVARPAGRVRVCDNSAARPTLGDGQRRRGRGRRRGRAFGAFAEICPGL